MVTYDDELGVVGAVLGLAAVPEGGVLPVEVDAVKVVLPEEPERGLDEGASAGGVGDHGGEPLRALVPAADGDQGLQVTVVGLQAGELAVAT